MAAAPEETDTATSDHGDLGPLVRAWIRATLTGSIFAMSVLAYLGDHETSLATAVVTVAGTGLVIFFAEVYAGLFSMALASAHALPAAEVRHEVVASSAAAAPGVLAGLFLLLADTVGIATPTAIDIALWAGVLTLLVCSVVEALGSHRSILVRAASVVVSVVVGVVIIVLKAQLH